MSEDKPQSSPMKPPTLKRIVGVDFTETVIRSLHDRGFSSIDTSHDSHGYKAYFFPLQDQSGQSDGFEIQVVTDEEIYAREHHLEHFFPFFQAIESPRVSDLKHRNSAFEILGLWNQKFEGELELFLKLKKAFVPGAIVLRCHDWSRFREVAKPDRVFKENVRAGSKSESRSCALVHLGLSCFDLVVIGPDESEDGLVTT